MIMGLNIDALESVMNRVPTIDLVPASHVSPEWNDAVQSSLRRHPRQSPWLLVHHLRISSIHAFDPFSSSWASLPQNSPSFDTKPNRRMTFLRGSSGDRLHTLSASAMVVSEDSFGTAWRKEVKAPKLWMHDAVMAEVGRWIVVAGGGCPMLRDEGPVEVYDKHAGLWESAEPIPEGFDGSTSATGLSVAASDERLYLIEKATGLVGMFDPNSKRWEPTCQPISDPTVQSWAVAIGYNERLLVVGVGPDCQSTMMVRLWEVNPETLQGQGQGHGLDSNLEEEMPREMVERLFPTEKGDYDTWQSSSTWQSCSVEVCGTERGGYVYNPSEMRNGAVFYEFGEEMEKGSIVKRWEWVPLPEKVRECGIGRMEFGCSAIGLDELHAVF